MGQKTNPNIFRLGVSKTWKTEFFEKKSHELPLYTFKDLELKNYIERFLELQGIFLHDYKQYYSNSTLYFYISYFVSSDFIIQKRNKNSHLVLVNSTNEKKIIDTNKVISNFTLNKINNDVIKDSSFILNFSSDNLYIMKRYLQANSLNLKNSILEKNVISDKVLNVEGLLNDMFKVLSLFTNRKFNIIVNFCCLNKNLTFLKGVQKKNFLLLQKFRKTPFLKEGMELMFHVVYNRNSANLLAKFIALQIKKVKRHKFFLAFLKQTLTVLISSSLSKVKGSKIIVKGRLNGVPRANYKIITVGDVPVQSLKAKVDYSQVTIHNSNGSYGIKVWIIEKD